jgi:hypothetical protein
MIGCKELNVVAVEGIGTVKGGHHSFRVKSGQAVQLAILRFE